MPSYTLDQLDDLEEQAQEPSPQYQRSALALVSSLLEQNAIAYGVMGGMNFYLRGSGRTTGDVDIAVDNQPRMSYLLDIFNGQRKSVPSRTLCSGKSITDLRFLVIKHLATRQQNAMGFRRCKAVC